MAETNGKWWPDDTLLDLLDRFDGMMHAMVRQGLTLRSFQTHVTRLYVAAAVEEAGGNYAKAATKIGLHRNTVRAIMRGRMVRQYGEPVQPKGGGQVERE